MARGRRLVAVAALAAASGCALTSAGGGPASPGAFSRPAHLDPWRMAGPVPTASTIQGALYEGAYDIDLARCPFFVATCIWQRSGAQTPRVRLTVDEVRCSSLEAIQDRCTFRLTEAAAGHDPVRSSCTGYFTIVGTSHAPSRWSIDYFGERRPDPSPALVCKRGNAERHAIW